MHAYNLDLLLNGLYNKSMSMHVNKVIPTYNQ